MWSYQEFTGSLTCLGQDSSTSFVQSLTHFQMTRWTMMGTWGAHHGPWRPGNQSEVALNRPVILSQVGAKLGEDFLGT